MPLPPGVYAKKVLTSSGFEEETMTQPHEERTMSFAPDHQSVPRLITPSTSIFLPRSGGVCLPSAPTNNKGEPCALSKNASTLGVVSIFTGSEAEQKMVTSKGWVARFSGPSM